MNSRSRVCGAPKAHADSTEPLRIEPERVKATEDIAKSGVKQSDDVLHKDVSGSYCA